MSVNLLTNGELIPLDGMNKKAIGHPHYVGTLADYQVLSAAGLIDDGTLVLIIDDDSYGESHPNNKNPLLYSTKDIINMQMDCTTKDTWVRSAMNCIRLMFQEASTSTGFKFTARYEGYGWITGEIYGLQKDNTCWGGCYVLGYGDSTTDIYSYSYIYGVDSVKKEQVKIETVEVIKKELALSDELTSQFIRASNGTTSASKTWTVGTDIPAGRKIIGAYMTSIVTPGVMNYDNPGAITAKCTFTSNSITLTWLVSRYVQLDQSMGATVSIIYFYE